MSNILTKLEEDLAKAKKRHAIFVKLFSDEKSLGGKAITNDERDWLRKTANNITLLEQSIAQHKLILENADLQDSINGYQRLKNLTNDHFKKIRNTHDAWMEHIYAVGSDYSTAYENFESIIKAQSKYEADMAAIATSIVAVAGLGTLSWIADSKKLVTVLGSAYDRYERAIQIGEDITQAAFDKVTGYVAGKLPRDGSPTMDTPFAFQNEILLKALGNLRPIMKVVLKYEGTLNAFQESLGQMRLQPGGKQKGTAIAKREYEKYLEMSSIITENLKETQSWINTLPESTLTGQNRIDEFSRMFWQKWLPTLETVTPGYHVPGGNYTQGHDIPASVDHSDWWLSRQLLNELDRLLDLNKLGIGEGGLDWWVSDNDVRLLVLWARTHPQKLRF